MAVLVEFVGRAGAVVDQVDEAVEAPVLTRADEEFGQFGDRRRAALAEFAGLFDHRVGGADLRAGGFAVGAERLQRDGRGGRERGQRPGRLGQRRSGLGQRFGDRRARLGEVFEARHRPPQLAQEGRQLAQRRFDVGALFGARLRRRAGVGEEAGDAAALARERSEDLLGVGGELGEPVALGAEDAEDAIDVAQHRVRPLDHFLEVFAAAGEAGAEFVEDQAEALRVGQLVDVVDQVRVDAGAVVLERQQVLARPRLRRLRSSSAAAAASSPGRAAASGGSRRTSRRSATAAGSGRRRRRGSPGSRDRSIFIAITALPGTEIGLPFL